VDDRTVLIRVTVQTQHLGRSSKATAPQRQESQKPSRCPSPVPDPTILFSGTLYLVLTTGHLCKRLVHYLAHCQRIS
jgi:hypothetical protein